MADGQNKTTIPVEMWNHFQKLAKEDHDYLTAEIERLCGIIRELRAVHESMGDLFISTRDEIQ